MADARDPASSAGPRPLAERPPTGEPRLDALARLLDVVDRLRAPEDGCPWDLEQTEVSLAPSLVEEAHEALEAIEADSAAGDDREADAREAPGELGDLLMAVILVARIAQDHERFDLADVARRVSDKLVRRHPHVFGAAQVDSTAHVLENWEAIKKAERAERDADTSALAGVPKALPALQRADRLNAKAMAVGFRWSDARGALAKLYEELGELEAEYPGAGEEPRELDAARRARLEHELGDVLLAGATAGSYLGIDPERALREALRRYERRFRDLEQRLGGEVRGRSLDELLEVWRAVKNDEA